MAEFELVQGRLGASMVPPPPLPASMVPPPRRPPAPLPTGASLRGAGPPPRRSALPSATSGCPSFRGAIGRHCLGMCVVAHGHEQCFDL
jgi:hypothetical protein